MAAPTHARFDTLAEFPGGGDLSLTRAIVLYREDQAVDGIDPGIDDLGLALALDGEYAAATEALDLGSGRLRHLDLSTEVVVLDWLYASTLDYVRLLLHSDPAPHRLDGASSPLRRFCTEIAHGVLGRVGFGPLTRTPLLRIGFRDIVRDLDPNERPVIRIAAGSTGYFEVAFDAAHNALAIAGPLADGDLELERLLAAAFPGAATQHVGADARPRYRLRFPLPVTCAEAADLLTTIRHGVLALIARFEPDRHGALQHALQVFGPRDTLTPIAGASPRASRAPYVLASPAAAVAVSGVV